MTEKVRILPVHPSSTNAFKEWFRLLTANISLINQADPFSSEFNQVAEAFVAISVEVSYENIPKTDRSKTSVYDRTDYVVREVLRTSRLQVLIGYMKSISTALLNENMKINDKGVVVYNNAELSPMRSSVILREIPTTFALMFTAVETISTVNIDDLLRIFHSVLLASKKKLATNVELETSQNDVFTGTVAAVHHCLKNLKSLNTSLFFTMFQELELFELLVEAAVDANEVGRFDMVNTTSQCINAYIQASQAEPDLKKNAENEQFIEKYKKMIDLIVKPFIKQGRQYRQQFRSILHYCDSLPIESDSDSSD